MLKTVHHVAGACCTKRFLAKAATADSNAECQDLTDCDGSESYQAEAPTLTTDRVCAPLSAPCDESGQMESEPPSPTSDRVCVATTSTTTTTTSTTTTTTTAPATTPTMTAIPGVPGSTTGAAAGGGGTPGGTAAGGTATPAAGTGREDGGGGGGGDDDASSVGGATLAIQVESTGKLKKMTKGELAALERAVLQQVAAKSGVATAKMKAEATLTGSRKAMVVVTFDGSIDDAVVRGAQANFAVSDDDDEVTDKILANQITVTAGGKELTAGMTAGEMTASKSASSGGDGSGSDSTTTAVVVVLIIVILLAGLIAAVIVKQRQAAKLGAGSAVGFGLASFGGQEHREGVSNPAYADPGMAMDGTGIDGAAGSSGYMDVDANASAGTSNTGYMDVSPAPAQAQAQAQVQVQGAGGGFEGFESDGEDV